jgi:hypothetical protein
VKAAAPKPGGRRRARPASTSRQTKIFKATPCKAASGRRHGRKKGFDTSGKSPAHIHHPPFCKTYFGPSGQRCRRDCTGLRAADDRPPIMSAIPSTADLSRRRGHVGVANNGSCRSIRSRPLEGPANFYETARPQPVCGLKIDHPPECGRF